MLDCALTTDPQNPGEAAMDQLVVPAANASPYTGTPIDGLITF